MRGLARVQAVDDAAADRGVDVVVIEPRGGHPGDFGGFLGGGQFPADHSGGEAGVDRLADFAAGGLLPGSRSLTTAPGERSRPWSGRGQGWPPECETLPGDRDVLAEREVGQELAEQWPELEGMPGAAASDHQRSRKATTRAR